MSTADQRVIHRVVFPADKDLDVLPLYVDEGLPPQPEVPLTPRDKAEAKKNAFPAPERTWHPDDILSRRSIKVRSGARLSTASYFNAFPAAYWRRWTVLEEITLTVRTSGLGSIVVYKSTATGQNQRVDSRVVSGDDINVWQLPLAPFGDGGWYWFDLIADADGMTLLEAEYSTPNTGRVGRLSLGTTTFNRADYCVKTIEAVAGDPALMEILDEFIVVDQGTETVRERPEYPELQERLGTRLHIIEQANLGGSGGFSRNMMRVLETGSDHLLLLDDDVLVETEGILRATAFADFCMSPTIVGGHMFELQARSILHAWGEGVNRFNFIWGPVEGLDYRHDFAQHGLRRSPDFHKRWDTDYNGWWMCLIPRTVIEEIGLSMPNFIKWDDVEYGMRAQSRGIPTVTLPGAAVWHLSWAGKDDTIDWQAYFHLRNRLVTALVYSPFEHGGGLLLRCIATDAKHIFAMQSYASNARLEALRDVLSGPEHMHATLGSKAAALRAMKNDYSDATFKPRPQDFPAPQRAPGRVRRTSVRQPSWLALPFWLAKHAPRQFLVPPAPESREHPEAYVAKQDATWWRLATLDSALVSSADGTGVSWHRRDDREARQLFKEFSLLYTQLRNRWGELRAVYQESHARDVSPELWKETFERESGSGQDSAGGQRP